MKKIKFAVIGSGWRAQFYIRIAKAVPDMFELTDVLIRDKIKGEKFSHLWCVCGTDNRGNSEEESRLCRTCDKTRNYFWVSPKAIRSGYSSIVRDAAGGGRRGVR